MAVTQTFGSAGASQAHHGSTQSVDAFKNEGGGHRHQPANMEHSELRQDAELAVKSAKEALGNVRDMAGDVYDAAKKSATDAVGNLNDMVVRHPSASVGIAAGAALAALASHVVAISSRLDALDIVHEHQVVT